MSASTITPELICGELQKGLISRNVARALLQALYADTMPGAVVRFNTDPPEEDPYARDDWTPKQEPKALPGFIYILKSEDSYYKIGGSVLISD